MWQIIRELDLLEFLDDYDVNYETSGKNIGDGWIGISPCPFCGDDRNHFGISTSDKRINCWVCGTTGTIIKFLMKYFDMSKEDALDTIKEHLEEAEFTQDQDLESLVHKTFTKMPKVVEEPKVSPRIKLLPGRPITKELVEERPKLRAFLKERMISVESCMWHRFRYDYEKSMRVVMPIFDVKGRIIAYQGRDVTGKALLSYITQPKGVDLGKTMFNIDNYTGEKNIVVVEGILDAVRVENAYHFERACVMACFTSIPTLDQLLLLPETEKVVIMLDSDAWTNYKKFEDLPMEVEPVILPKDKDPGSLTDEEFSELNLSQYFT